MVFFYTDYLSRLLSERTSCYLGTGCCSVHDLPRSFDNVPNAHKTARAPFAIKREGFSHSHFCGVNEQLSDPKFVDSRLSRSLWLSPIGSLVRLRSWVESQCFRVPISCLRETSAYRVPSLRNWQIPRCVRYARDRSTLSLK